MAEDIRVFTVVRVIRETAVVFADSLAQALTIAEDPDLVGHTRVVEIQTVEEEEV